MTNFEKICKGSAEELAEIAKDEFVKWLNSPAPIRLTQTEREICVGLRHMEQKYIARDKNDKLFAFTAKPTKEPLVWNLCEHNPIRINTKHHIFHFIKWEDEEPTSIDELLEG